MRGAYFFRSAIVSSVTLFGASWNAGCVGFAAWHATQCLCTIAKASASLTAPSAHAHGAATTNTASAAACAARPYSVARVRNRGCYGIRIDDPVVWRVSKSTCDLAASLSAYFW